MTAFLSLFSLRISATSSLFASDWSEACNTLHLASCEKLRLKRSLTGHEEVDKNQSKPVGVVASPDSSHGIERDWSEEYGPVQRSSRFLARSVRTGLSCPEPSQPRRRGDRTGVPLIAAPRMCRQAC